MDISDLNPTSTGGGLYPIFPVGKKKSYSNDFIDIKVVEDLFKEFKKKFNME